MQAGGTIKSSRREKPFLVGKVLWSIENFYMKKIKKKRVTHYPAQK